MTDHLWLSNRLYEIINGNLTCMETWGFYLFEPVFDDEPELRNKIGVIWFCSLLDTLYASEQHLPKIAAEAGKKGFHSLQHNAAEMKKFCGVVGTLIAQYSREEQAFLVNLRNQYVHGYLNGRHQRTINFRFYAEGRVKQDALPFAEYNDLVRPFYENGQDLDLTVRKLLAAVLDRTHLYWRIAEALRRQKDDLYRIIREGEKFSIDLSESSRENP
jgi:hypothetical protein